MRPAYLGPMSEPMNDNFQRLLLRGRDMLRPLVPKRWRGVPLVPVVRLSGVIGFSTPLKPGLTLAGLARALDRAFGMGKPKGWPW